MVALRALAVGLLATCAAALAGCAGGVSGSGEPDSDDLALPGLAAGKGAIQGLLVDDAFRPLHLTDTPSGPYDRIGFILVQETGTTLQTDASGQFTMVGLDPGSYTLKPSVEGHEGAPQRVDVTAGEYAEVDVLVRRLMTPGKDTIVVQDDTILITCTVQVLDGHLTAGRLCHADLSGSESNNFVDYNYTGVGAVAAIVVETQLSRSVDFEIWLTRQANLVDSPNLYGKVYGYDSSYLRHQALDGNETGRFGGAALDTSDLRVWVNVNGPGTQEADELTGLPVGVDVTFVIEARIIVSAFLEVPPDLDSYAVLS